MFPQITVCSDIITNTIFSYVNELLHIHKRCEAIKTTISVAGRHSIATLIAMTMITNIAYLVLTKRHTNLFHNNVQQYLGY